MPEAFEIDRRGGGRAAVGSHVGNWWDDYFDDVYLRIYEPLLPAAETDREIAAIRELLEERAARRILDVPCGWGRHSIELARLGFAVTGVDASEFVLGEAARRAAEAGVAVEFTRSDMRRLRLSGEFDAALCLFSSLGYFVETPDIEYAGDTGSVADAGDLAVLSGIRSTLAPRGVLLIETTHRDAVAREFAERDWWESPSGDTVWVARAFDPIGGVSHEVLRWRDATGQEGEKRHSIRIRAASEWADLLARAGFRPLEWYGDWSLEPFERESERLIVLCEKA